MSLKRKTDRASTLFPGRRWGTPFTASPEEVARMTHEASWVLCAAFLIPAQEDGAEDLLLLNHSLSEDSVAEWGVYRRRDGAQVESLTVGWSREGWRQEMGHFLRSVARGEVDFSNQYGTSSDLNDRIDWDRQGWDGYEGEGHHRCRRCA